MYRISVKPVITGITGIVTEGLKKNLETIPGRHSVDSLHTRVRAHARTHKKLY